MIQLPKYTFLNGPPSSGKSTLAVELCKQDHELCLVSFADPLRHALLATLYPDELYTPTPSLDLKDEAVKNRLLQVGGMTHRQWLIAYGEWLHKMHGRDILSRLSRRTCDEQENFYNRFVFDDLRFIADLDSFTATPRDCLIIQLERPPRKGFDIGDYVVEDQVPWLRLENSTTIEQVLDKLKNALGTADNAAAPQMEQL